MVPVFSPHLSLVLTAPAETVGQAEFTSVAGHMSR